jgi:hypothetical protein
VKCDFVCHGHGLLDKQFITLFVSENCPGGAYSVVKALFIILLLSSCVFTDEKPDNAISAFP